MKLFIIFSILPLAWTACPDVITRPEWKANYPINGILQCMASPSHYVLIHHTYIPKVCVNTQDCKQKMKSMQEYHQKTRKWNDIGYNFCIGGMGEIYEGRGWGAVGYPSNGYQFNSTNICFIGDYQQELPNEKMLQSAVNLIECGINLGFITYDPQILGIREVISTASPGDALQKYIEVTRFGYPRKLFHNNEIKYN